MLNWTITTDNLGRTYESRLPQRTEMPPKWNSISDEWVTSVMMWYDRNTRDWVVSYSDGKTHQVGGSDRVYSRREAEELAQYLYDLAVEFASAHRPDGTLYAPGEVR